MYGGVSFGGDPKVSMIYEDIRVQGAVPEPVSALLFRDIARHGPYKASRFRLRLAFFLAV